MLRNGVSLPICQGSGRSMMRHSVSTRLPPTRIGVGAAGEFRRLKSTDSTSARQLLSLGWLKSGIESSTLKLWGSVFPTNFRDAWWMDEELPGEIAKKQNHLPKRGVDQMKRRVSGIVAMVISVVVIVTCGIGFAASDEEVSNSCVAPARGPILAMAQESAAGQVQNPATPPQPVAKVGKPAPDFEANAYVNGGFKNVKLSDLKGKWVALCFYPGDFTFV